MAPRTYNPCSYLPRRLQIVTSLALFILFCIVLFGQSTVDVPYRDEVNEGARRVSAYLPKTPGLPSGLNPFRTPAHSPPPEQANSTSGEARWFSDWKWMNPFSSSITLDENRAVLPPLTTRPPVYTYFDADWYKDESSLESVDRLLLIWRRAWWAQGFKPVILGSAEAMNNPLYAKLASLQLEDELKTDVMRWLAWGNMGTGIMANYVALPMAPHSDPLLAYLRRGDYPQLTRYEGLESGLFNGPKDQINKVIEQAFNAKKPVKAKSVIELLPKETFHIDSNQKAIAFYSSKNINKFYKGIAEKLASDNKDVSREGLRLLPQLIVSHLHTIWQNSFSSGIAVLKPLPDHMFTLVKPAIELARNLSQCTESPQPSSCPPNREKCVPCVSSHPLRISQPMNFRNTSDLFTIGTVPHPYTMASLQHQTDSLTIRFIRRTTKRDEWLLATTKEFSTGTSSFSRIPLIKDAVASDYGSARSLWLTPENLSDENNAKLRQDLAWSLGFPVPTIESTLDSGHSETPVPGPERRPPAPKPEGKVPDPVELVREGTLLGKARLLIKGKGPRNSTPIRDAVEAWNLADTEVWRFVRAWNARRSVERRKWEAEEKAYAGTEGGKGSWSRWFDKDSD
ncbi:hypothetical protein AUEXF2481DRAFT_37603 [Aureobasidium subglaciale EXF-2481]|uniref:Uncharacterized protein n=1 Tax=Aureobasidium subglaciale (strain EXF-2481) TaxID=1043005 RepID=A0A074YJQ6_AURSE|nr:uncharacterized protein AUEXF2481DRAFT_37603 [Aureobasidium subglaciale EXF-2481]KAI5202445.1 hypothetical protein E4T38_05570 [Aureobasidium subglaciale]KAI5221315.1 hypothetical protein E4T40_05503 [Aureobasidium subglaciale]KAI5225227.1 hypothetical protein E4T41_05322 [Aureobasidium subglaciale]KAI5261271.1 hypothetical protein E4T46_05254 [Aureobasidium subglaciale]KEQ98028.1 hypothetical protein AUEXF2481DRAFT_37603 [Aureobasidium subglaciale EXF-2481]